MIVFVLGKAVGLPTYRDDVHGPLAHGEINLSGQFSINP